MLFLLFTKYIQKKLWFKEKWKIKEKYGSFRNKGNFSKRRNSENRGIFTNYSFSKLFKC